LAGRRRQGRRHRIHRFHPEPARRADNFEGKVFAPFSGLWGDCGVYRGRVIGISTSGLAEPSTFATRANGGGIWGQGGVTNDGSSLFAATGNTMGTDAWGDGEAVLRFAPDLARPIDKRDFFAPSDWHDLDNQDLDLGGTAPLPLNVPVPDGTRALILAIGKNGFAYLVDRASLGGMGGELTRRKVTTNVAVAGPATWSTAGGALVALQGKGAACPGTGARGLIALKIVGESEAGDRFCVVRRRRRRWVADRHHHGRKIRRNRVGPRRRRRQQIVCVQRSNWRADYLVSSYARSASFSDTDRDRGPPLCRGGWDGLRVCVLI
jgi:hypothetical protein